MKCQWTDVVGTKLHHLPIEIPEISQRLGSSSGVSIGRVKPFVMLNKDIDSGFFGCSHEILMIDQGLSGRLRDENMHSPLDGIKCHWIMGRVRRKDGDRRALECRAHSIQIVQAFLRLLESRCLWPPCKHRDRPCRRRGRR